MKKKLILFLIIVLKSKLITFQEIKNHFKKYKNPYVVVGVGLSLFAKAETLSNLLSQTINDIDTFKLEKIEDHDIYHQLKLNKIIEENNHRWLKLNKLIIDTNKNKEWEYNYLKYILKNYDYIKSNKKKLYINPKNNIFQNFIDEGVAIELEQKDPFYKNKVINNQEKETPLEKLQILFNSNNESIKKTVVPMIQNYYEYYENKEKLLKEIENDKKKLF